jgi:hypothetical protein
MSQKSQKSSASFASKRVSLVAGLVAACAVLFAGIQLFGASASSNTLYSYDLQTVYGNSVANAGTMNANVPLKLSGSWGSAPGGVNFQGNKVNASSIGTAVPTSGNSINLSANAPLAFGVAFTYTPPATGACFSDSSNLVQIGRDADYATQAKLQFSKCGDSKKIVFMECRLAGNSSPKTTKPIKSTLALVPGASYVAACSRDVSYGTTKQTITVTKLDAANGNNTVTNTFTVATTGVLQSTKALSVANKYPVPSQSQNTDQYVGLIKKVAYCTGTTIDEANACLASELPLY